jgi:hypothetical protein
MSWADLCETERVRTMDFELECVPLSSHLAPRLNSLLNDASQARRTALMRTDRKAGSRRAAVEALADGGGHALVAPEEHPVVFDVVPVVATRVAGCDCLVVRAFNRCVVVHMSLRPVAHQRNAGGMALLQSVARSKRSTCEAPLTMTLLDVFGEEGASPLMRTFNATQGVHTKASVGTSMHVRLSPGQHVVPWAGPAGQAHPAVVFPATTGRVVLFAPPSFLSHLVLRYHKPDYGLYTGDGLCMGRVGGRCHRIPHNTLLVCYLDDQDKWQAGPASPSASRPSVYKTLCERKAARDHMISLTA